MAKFILFDADHTLYMPKAGPAYARQFDFLAGKTKLPAEKIEQAWKAILQEIISSGTRDLVKRSREYSLGEAFKALGVRPRKGLVEEAVEVFWKEELRHVKPAPEIEKALAQLKASGYRMAVISDEFRRSLEMKMEKIFGAWEKHFMFLVSADDAGELKPSKKYYELAVQRFKAGPEQVIVVGDSWEKDLELAKELGMKTVLVGKENRGRPDAWIRKISELPKAIGGLK